MRRAFRASIIVFFLTPFVLVLLAAGLVFLWENPWLLKWLWIPVPLCWAMAYLLLRLVKRHHGPLWQPRTTAFMHWTDRDRQAWQKVLRYADQTGAGAANRFFELALYAETSWDLARQLAEHYHPHATDPIENLTIPEILSATELAISDVRRFVEQNIPGSHLMTIRWLKKAPQVTGYWNRLRPIVYAATVIWHPWNVLSRAAANETVVTPVMDELKKEGMVNLYRVFVLQLGKYLIELNSHRLMVGPDRWRELCAARSSGGAATTPLPMKSAAESTTVTPLQIAVVGQVKAGKSSLVNALIGNQQAAVDILPLTASIDKYTIHSAGAAAPLVVLDTTGYGHEGLQADRVEETMRAVCASAMTLLVINACDPARQPDCHFLRTMDTWFAAHPERRPPPVLVVLTHIDGLSPTLEWLPPYDGWVEPHPRRPKEQNIRAAVLTIQDLLQQRVEGVIPACTDMDHGRVYGVTQWVVPALLNLLPQATAKHLLDVLYDQRDAGHFAKLMTQLWSAASLLAKYHFCGPEALLPDPDRIPNTKHTD